MKHADEGSLHAYLDGELSPDEVTDLERHVSVCASCRALLAEAKGFLAESDSLVLALDVPVAARPRRPARRPAWSTLAWAAMVVLALGTGYALRPALGPRAAESVIDAGKGEGSAITSQVAPAPVTPPSGTPAMNAAPAPTARRAPSAAGGAGSVAESRDLALATERQDAGGMPAPAPSAAPAQAAEPQAAEPTPASPAATQEAPRANYALVDGTPVDTTTPRLNFGPRSDAAPRRITLDEAVTHLGGTIRLIDGLAPQRVELLAGVDVEGADPDREVVRVYYEEPDLGLVTLDQQRPGPSFAARDSRTADESEFRAFTVNPTVPRPSSPARLRAGLPSNTISWRSDGVWLSLSSRLTGDKLATLQARVK